VTGNSWLGDTGSTALVDAIRLIGSRSGGSATLLQSNMVSGGRFAIRSEQSTWTLQLSHIHGSAIDVVLSAADTATLASDSLANALSTCVQANGAATRLSVMGGAFAACGPAGSAAIAMNASGGALDVTSGATFVGAGQRAVAVATAHHVGVIGNVMVGGAGGAAPAGPAANGVVDLQADSMVVVGNVITGYPSYAAIALAGGIARADSNFLSRNQLGLMTGSAQSIEAGTNDVFDNDTAGVVNEVAAGISLPGNWWGDSLGPRTIGGPSAVGDSVVGNVTVQPVGLTPLNSGSRPAAPLRLVRGNGQSVSQGTTAGLPLAVRVVDAAGRPVPGVAVTFAVSAGSGGASLNGIGPTVTVNSNGSGLAEASLTMGTPGTFTVTATNAATGTVTFTETATQ
jgi:hypothetical protein